MKLYGIFLSTYKDQSLNMWIHDSNGRVETSDYKYASSIKEEYSKQNPDGFYAVKEILQENKDV